MAGSGAGHDGRNWGAGIALTVAQLRGRVLVVAGSDSGGGAGIQADIKTISALGGYAATAITALTAQNTTGVYDVLPVTPAFIARQIEVVLGDIGADAIKTGMLGDAASVEAIASAVANCPVPLVLDPVMQAKGGARLLTEQGIGALKRGLIPLAAVITPNLPEAELLAGMAIPDRQAMYHAASALLSLGARAVLLKGGHLPGDTVVDVLATPDGVEEFAEARIVSRHTHGTGCTLASAIATGLAQGMPLREAVLRARSYVRAAIATAPGFGAGHGPLNHAVLIASPGGPG
jgi:hydroxymethylpyrimidine/phosphomethylpyrimidine kinase